MRAMPVTRRRWQQLFQTTVRDLGAPTLVVHNIDGRVPGIFGKAITEADPGMALETASKFGVQRVPGRSAGRSPHARKQAERPWRERNDHLHECKRCTQRLPQERRLCRWHAMPSPDLLQSMARELMPQGIHVANVPIDAAIGGLRKTVPARTAGQDQPLTTTWLTLTASRRPICSCIASIGRTWAVE